MRTRKGMVPARSNFLHPNPLSQDLARLGVAAGCYVVEDPDTGLLEARQAAGEG